MGFLRSIKNLQKQAKKISVTPGAISVQLDPEELAWINSHPAEWKAMYKKTEDDEMSRVYGPDWREHKAIERLHFSLHNLIEREWFKYKKGEPGARESLIAACQRQIALGPRFARAWREQNKAIGDHRFDDGWLPHHIGFHKLISLMWREENFAEAFRLADLASAQGWGGDLLQEGL